MVGRRPSGRDGMILIVWMWWRLKKKGEVTAATLIFIGRAERRAPSPPRRVPSPPTTPSTMGRRLTYLCALLLVLGACSAAADSRKHGPKAHAADADAPPAVVSGAALAAADTPEGSADPSTTGPAPNVRKSHAGEGLAPFDSPGAMLLFRVATALGAAKDDAALPKPPSPAELAADAGAAMMG